MIVMMGTKEFPLDGRKHRCADEAFPLYPLGSLFWCQPISQGRKSNKTKESSSDMHGMVWYVFVWFHMILHGKFEGFSIHPQFHPREELYEVPGVGGPVPACLHWNTGGN